jgi:crotonobetainyl-CoA:carnitine CoA-transferase CaiB-like acyl-CoA transferase
VGALKPSTGALSGLRVVDLSRVLAGPYCAQMLGDHGATVIKVESPSGDEARTFGPYLADGRSAYYEALNRNKRNISLDLNTPEGRGVLAELISSADIVIENFKSGTMARWGFDYETVLAPRQPSLIYCQITGFGVDGPLGGLPGYDAALQAFAGLMSVNGEANADAIRIGVPIVDIITGVYSFAGIMLALNERARSGSGQLVDCALLDAALSVLLPHSAGWLGADILPVRTGNAHPGIAPYDTFPSRTGPIFIGAANDRQFATLCEILGRPEISSRPEFKDNATRVANVMMLRAELTKHIAVWDALELSRALWSQSVAASPVNTVAEALLSEQTFHRSMVVDIGDYRGIGIPIKLSRTPGSIKSEPADRNADARVVLHELDQVKAGLLVVGEVLGGATAPSPRHTEPRERDATRSRPA